MSGQKYECVNRTWVHAFLGSYMFLPCELSDFIPRAPLYTPNQFWQVMISDAGVVLWITALAYWTYARGLSEMLRIYFVPYLWVNQYDLVLSLIALLSNLCINPAGSSWSRSFSIPTLDSHIIAPSRSHSLVVLSLLSTAP
jgi:hypothetical protein